ncbi:MAG TPA: DUF4836 family protein [Bacteroidia bacterium]|nr:DUF4836 family protein [Bacteroidia bacterium]
MRKFLVIAAFSIVFLAGIAMLAWFFFIRRSLPEYASCIPSDSFLVVTLNTKNLAVDQAKGGHLFPEFAIDKKQPALLKEIRNAVERSGGSGIKLSSDVLGFVYRENETAFWGACFAVDDSAQAAKFVRQSLLRDFPVHIIDGGRKNMFGLDSSSAVFSWNRKTFLVLYPVSDNDSAVVAAQCEKLLAQDKKHSLLSNPGFREHELSSFDIGVWIQAKPLLEFTNGGSLFTTMLFGVDNISLQAEFNDGEIDVRRTVKLNEDGNKSPVRGNTMLLSCRPEEVKGFLHTPLNLDDTVIKAEMKMPPLKYLPFTDEQNKELFQQLDGNAWMLFHDTISFPSDYITYEYDEDFRQVPVTKTVMNNQRSLSYCFGLKNADNVRSLVRKWMAEDTVKMEGNYWRIGGTNPAQRLFVTPTALVITDWPSYDGKDRPAPAEWYGKEMLIPAGEFATGPDMLGLSFLFPKIDRLEGILSGCIGDLTLSTPLQTSAGSSSEFRLVFTERKINALIQAEEIVLKSIGDGN